MGIRNNRYKAMVPTVTGALKLKGRVHGSEARYARAHTVASSRSPCRGR
jgi:5-methyltetrahydropteroyltriglutamate--homocysteine methyltransferase